MTTDELAMLKAHALNTLRVMPGHVDANDKLRLCQEVERLRAALAVMAKDHQLALNEPKEGDEK